MKKMKIVCGVFSLILLFGISGCSDGSSSHGTAAAEQGLSEDALAAYAAYDIAGITTNMDTSCDITLEVEAPATASLSYGLDAAPLNGALSGAGPNVIYTPAAGYVGDDSFTYYAVDAATGESTNIATVSIRVLGTGMIQAMGGEGLFNDGGTGGAMVVSSYRNLSIMKNGAVDASFSVPVFVEELGTNPVVVTSNTEVTALSSSDPEPQLGALYTMKDPADTNLYISNNDGTLAGADDVATGLEVQEGVTLLLQSNFFDYMPEYHIADYIDDDLVATYTEPEPSICLLSFSNDVVVKGTIKTKPIDEDDVYGSNDKASLGISASGHIIVYATGKFDLAGGTGSPLPVEGGDGGKLWLASVMSMVLKGELDTSGGIGITTGGNGGFIGIAAADATIYNLGIMNTNGGTGEGGGNGGAVYIYNMGNDIYSAGPITSMGGASARSAAGNGGMIYMFAGTEADTGNLIMSSNLNTSGGDAAVSDNVGNGGNGGDIWLSAYIGNMKLTGDMITNGGMAGSEQSNGGNAGNIWVNDFGSVYDATTGTIQMISPVEANGGQGEASGGAGGIIYINTLSDSSEVAWSHDVQLLGYQTIDLSGAYGSQNGGYGGNMLLQVHPQAGAGYALLNETDIMATGGYGESGYGGTGGNVQMENFSEIWDIASLTNSGAIDISDGNGAFGVYELVDYQYVLFYSSSVVNNSGTIAANGGIAEKAESGSSGGMVEMISQQDDVNNTATVSANGGDGVASGGDGGILELNAQGLVTNSGSLYFQGGNDGGTGGAIEIVSGDPSSVITASLITVEAGTGGVNGTILIDLFDVTPLDGTLP